MKNINYLFLLLLLFFVGLGVYFVLKPFLIAIFVGFTLSQLFGGWHRKILNLLQNKVLSAFFTTLIVFVLIFLPLLLVGKMATVELVNTYKDLHSNRFQETLLKIENKIEPLWSDQSVLPDSFNRGIFLDEKSINKLTGNLATIFTTAIKYSYQWTSKFLFTIFIIFFCLYYFFKDGDRLIEKIFNLSPLKNIEEKKLLDNFVNVSRATLKGSLIIAIVQGFLTTVLFFFTGVDSAVLLGIITALTALVPMIGTVVVWLPVGITMLLLGYIWQGVTIILVGALLIGMVDNILRPQLVKSDTSLHPLLVFLSTLGGIGFFGLAGFLLGPVIVVLFLNLLDIYQNEFKEDLKKFNRSK